MRVTHSDLIDFSGAILPFETNNSYNLDKKSEDGGGDDAAAAAGICAVMLWV